MRIAMALAGVAAWYALAAWYIKRFEAMKGGTSDGVVFWWLASPVAWVLVALVAMDEWLMVPIKPKAKPQPKPTFHEDWDR